MSVGASALLDLLATRHSGDVFVPECKDGPTHGTNHLRLDAWAMKKSWANPCYDGYEIKVSRSDFMRDNKLHLYLPLCNRLWLVCPSGLIHPGEVPAPMGLLWAASTGSKLLAKKKAPYREIDPPINLLHYVLMCRTRIQKNDFISDNESREERAEFFRAFLDGRKSLAELGRRVRGRIGPEIKKVTEDAESSVRSAELRAAKAESRMELLERADKTLRRLGISGAWDLEDRIKEAMRGDDLVDRAVGLERQLREFREELGRLSGNEAQETDETDNEEIA